MKKPMLLRRWLQKDSFNPDTFGHWDLTCGTSSHGWVDLKVRQFFSPHFDALPLSLCRNIYTLGIVGIRMAYTAGLEVRMRVWKPIER